MKRNEATIPGFGGNGRTKGEAGGAPKGVGERQRRTAEKPADAAGDSGPGLSAAAGTGEAPPGAGGGGEPSPAWVSRHHSILRNDRLGQRDPQRRPPFPARPALRNRTERRGRRNIKDSRSALLLRKERNRSKTATTDSVSLPS